MTRAKMVKVPWSKMYLKAPCWIFKCNYYFPALK